MSNHITDDIKAVFFDYDDTLVGTIGTKWHQHKHVAKKHYDKDITDADIKLHWGKPLVAMICLLYGTENAEEASAHYNSYNLDFPKELFEPTLPILRRLKARGKLTGIITATIRISIEPDLEKHGMSTGLIDYLQTAEDTPVHKPDPKVFDPALEWLKEKGISPSEVLYVGDGLHDMRAAVGAGFNFIGVETGLVTAEQFREAGAKSLPSILDL